VTQRLRNATVVFSYFVTLVLAAAFSPVAAQNSPEQPFSPAPYKVGERLTYNVSFSSFVTAGHIELLVAARGNFFGREAVQLKGHVETTGTVHAALFAINNDYITYVDPVSGLPFRGEQIVRVASRTSEVSADFNQAAGTVTPPKRTGEILGTYDFLSAIYRVRAMPLSQGRFIS